MRPALTWYALSLGLALASCRPDEHAQPHPWTPRVCPTEAPTTCAEDNAHHLAGCPLDATCAMDIPLTSMCHAFSGPTVDGRCPTLDAFLSRDWWRYQGYHDWTDQTLRACSSPAGALIHVFEAWANDPAHNGGASLPLQAVGDWMDLWEGVHGTPPLRVWFFFDDAGEMLGVQQDSPTPYCCGPQRHAVDRWTYGEVPEVDCSNAISLPRDAFGG